MTQKADSATSCRAWWRSVRDYRCECVHDGQRCPAAGWRKWIIHNCAEEMGWDW